MTKQQCRAAFERRYNGKLCLARDVHRRYIRADVRERYRLWCEAWEACRVAA